MEVGGGLLNLSISDVKAAAPSHVLDRSIFDVGFLPVSGRSLFF